MKQFGIVAKREQIQRERHSRCGQFDRWHFCVGYLRVKRGGTEPYRAWVNTFLCECFADEATETVEPMPLYARRERFGDKLPEKVCLITAGVDVHPDRIEAQIIGWGEGEESWALEYEYFLGDPKKTGAGGVWEQLDKFLQTPFEHPCGAVLRVERTCVDSGHSTDEAYRFCSTRGLRGVYAIKGIKGIGLPVMNPPSKSGVAHIRLWKGQKQRAQDDVRAHETD